AGPPVPTVPAAPPVSLPGDLVTADAMSRADAEALIEYGRGLGADAAATGLIALGEIGVGNTTVASCLAVALLDLGVADAVGLGAGADSAILDRKRAVVSAALQRCGRIGSADPVGVMAALGGPEFAVLTGVVLGAVSAGTAIVLDGLATGLAALVAVRMEPAVAAHLVAGQRSRERAHAAVLTELGLEPLLDLRIRAGEGVGACLGAVLLRSALDIRRTTARVTY
ncbi:MAG TPA: nicotinate-nucleotide--dimethylbenzimidazole phosphoribosyltransferase, partial [Micromonosporaceae bacterium]